MDTWRIGFIKQFLEEMGFKYRNVLVWVKKNPAPYLRKVNFALGTETMLWMSRGKNTFNWKLGHSPNYYFEKVNYEEKSFTHPNKKSPKVIEWVMKYLSNEGDTILNPFLGSGTTMKVARDLKRNCIGIEINPKYIEIAKKRLNWGSSLSDKIEWEFKVVE